MERGSKYRPQVTYVGWRVPVESSIKFSAEYETDSTIAFVETLIQHKRDSSVSSNFERKKMRTDEYLHFDCCQRISHKDTIGKTFSGKTQANLNKKKPNMNLTLSWKTIAQKNF